LASVTVPLHEKIGASPAALAAFCRFANLVRETQLSVHDFVLPLFVSETLDERRHGSMPGVFQLPIEQIAAEAAVLETSAPSGPAFRDPTT